jgi:hypothetical protein
MTKLISNMIRIFHAVFWFVLFCGVLFANHIKIVFISTFLILISILLWSVVGGCFVSTLEDGFDPIRLRSFIRSYHEETHDETEQQQPVSAGAAFDLFSSWTRLDPKFFVIAFTYFIYFVLFFGFLKIFCFMNPMKY